MRLLPSELAGAFLIEIEPIHDERGFFARSFCAETFRAAGINPHVEQCNVSHNLRRGAIRGLHYQHPPHAEAKFIRCTRGAIFDVIADLRPHSPTFLRWIGVELSAENRRCLYAPEGFAHGFQSLCDDSEVFYQLSAAYHPESAAGVRHDDPALAITWPLPCGMVSERDRSFPLLDVPLKEPA